MSLFTPYRSSLSDSDQFRVVRVAAGRWHDTIRCKLILRKLDEASEKHPYRALSYVWGPSSVTDSIYLEDFSFQITLNLSCALRHLRNVDEDTFLWVDASCINQQDHQERSLQVGIMQMIYRNAEEVIVFMGDGRDHRVSRSQLMEAPPSPVITLHGRERDDSFLTDMLRTCQSSGQRKFAWCLTDEACALGLISLFSDQDAVEQGCLALVELNERIRYHLFECLRAFVICPWWRRIWVVQEIAVGTAVTIQYGTVKLSWEILVATANVWSRSMTRQVAINAGLEPENLKVFALFTNQLEGLEQTRKKWREGGTDLVRLLQEFSDRQASDDRDKVYGLLSLARKDQQYIKPNYELDVFGTYKATTLALIGNSRSLACWAGDLKRKFNRGLPSWVPDWSTAVDNGDKRRMDLFDSYKVNGKWTLKVIESEREYWTTVCDEMGLLIDSPAGRSARLPASLKSFVLNYVDNLMQRTKSLNRYRIDADELERSGIDRLTWDKGQVVTLYSTISYLKWCEEHEVLPRSGIGLLRRWIRDLKKRNETEFVTRDGVVHSSKIPEPPNDPSINLQIRQNLQNLRAAIKKIDVDMEHRTSNARVFINEIESVILGPEIILGVDIILAIERLMQQCWRLSSLCDGVTVCGPRQFGWADTKSAINTLVSWLWLSKSIITTGPAGKGEAQLDRGRIRQFAKTIIGGTCMSRHGGFYQNADDSALGPLEDWLQQCLMKTSGPGRVTSEKRRRIWAERRGADGSGDPGPYLDPGDDGIPEHLLRTPPAEGYTAPPSPFLEDIQVATDGRVFFLTENGSMGLGPASMQEKDSIHILPSGRAHFVLRHKPWGMKPPDSSAPEWMQRLGSDQHELIGDCYLHVDDGPDNQTSEEELVIQGSLPFEVLGIRCWLGHGRPIRETVMLV